MAIVSGHRAHLIWALGKRRYTDSLRAFFERGRFAAEMRQNFASEMQ